MSGEGRPRLQRFDGLVIDHDGRQAWLDDAPLALTSSEFALLSALAAHPRRAISSRELLEEMWGKDWPVDTTPLQVHVSRLRTKLGESGAHPRRVITVHGFGYRFEPGLPRDAVGQVLRDGIVGGQPLGGSPDVVIVLIAPDHTLLWIGNHIERLLGWRPQDLVGTSFFDLAAPEELPALSEIRDTLDAGDPVSTLAHLRTKSGAYRLIEAFIRPISAPQQSPYVFLAEWQAADGSAALADDASFNEGGIAHGAGAGQSKATRVVELVFDADLMLREVVPPTAFLGFDPADIIDTDFSVSPLDRQSRLSLNALLRDTGVNAVEAHFPAQAADGSTVVIRTVTTIVRDANGAFTQRRLRLYLPD